LSEAKPARIRMGEPRKRSSDHPYGKIGKVPGGADLRSRLKPYEKTKPETCGQIQTHGEDTGANRE